MEVEVLSLKTSARATEEYGDRPKGLFVGLMVRYTCLSGSCDYNPYDFTMRSDDGEEFDTAYSSFEPNLESGELRSGAKARGYVTYELKPGAYDLEFRTNSLSDDVAVWRIKVGKTSAANA